uniref:Uncharacterized protein n=1 Tax=Hippocampus comes TaxID=109280 RepID=A0A3Q2XUM9_HIPCM
MHAINSTITCCGIHTARQMRHGSSAPQDFHSKYGTSVLVGGFVFCTAVWSYVSGLCLLLGISKVARVPQNDSAATLVLAGMATSPAVQRTNTSEILHQYF